jgi:hypothetical protein
MESLTSYQQKHHGCTDHFYATLKLIRNNLTAWVDEVRTEEDPPKDFPTVQVTAKVADNGGNNFNGEPSYLSTSVLSYGSFESTGSANDHLPDDNCSQRSRNQRPHTKAAAPTKSADTREVSGCLTSYIKGTIIVGCSMSAS